MTRKNQDIILRKYGIEVLNPMQKEVQHTFHANDELVVLSPTGTGKTLAFMLPVFSVLEVGLHQVQCLIIVPSRELAIQIEQVVRDAGTGFKTNAAYGGQSFNQDMINLKHPPSILIGTPGRIADHMRRNTFSRKYIRFLILDEFDKSLEIGFEKEMKQIIAQLPNLEKKVLTSASLGLIIPEFVNLKDPVFINYLDEGISALQIKKVISPEKDKLGTLLKLICQLGKNPGIIFINYKDGIDRVSTFLYAEGIEHGCFHGGMEQRDREQVLIKFRNGTISLLLATDLAARGLDIPEIAFIVHYHLPSRIEEFTHRNGRTARMKRNGTAYIIQYSKEQLPDYLDPVEEEKLGFAPIPPASDWSTIFISGGRRDKISKGDIAGFLIKEGRANADAIGKIELKQDCAFIAVRKDIVKSLVQNLDQTKLKKRKLKVYPI